MYRIGIAHPQVFRSLNWTLDDTTTTLLKLHQIEPDYSSNFQHGFAVIKAWSEFAQEAWSGQNLEATEPCWPHHHDQFGRVMLYLAEMCLSRKDFAGKTSRFLDQYLPDSSFAQRIFSGPTGTDDRIFYRAWYRLIGHPDFLTDHVCLPDSTEYNYFTFLLSLSNEHFNLALIKKYVSY